MVNDNMVIDKLINEYTEILCVHCVSSIFEKLESNIEKYSSIVFGVRAFQKDSDTVFTHGLEVYLKDDLLKQQELLAMIPIIANNEEDRDLIINNIQYFIKDTVEKEFVN